MGEDEGKNLLGFSLVLLERKNKKVADGEGKEKKKKIKKGLCN